MYVRKTILLSVSLLLVTSLVARALDAITPQGLEVFSRMNVHSIVQDRIGAMWISTTRGLYRYNGHCLDHLTEELPWNCLSYEGGDAVTASLENEVLSFDIFSLECSTAPVCGVRPPTEFRCADGRVARALETGGFSVGGQIFCDCGSKPVSNVRGFARGDDGTLYIGAATGLYSLRPDGFLREEPIAGTYGCPVCCIYQNPSGDIWIGTYHNGVFLSPRDYPFEAVEGFPRGLMVNGVTQTPSGVLIFTDGQGVWRLDEGGCILMPDFGNHKFQGAYFDRRDGLVWAPVFREGLFAFDGSGEIIRRASISGAGIGSLTPVRRYGDDLLVGTSRGLFLFNPSEETVVTRRADVADGLVYSLREDGSGRIWLAGEGIFVLDGKDVGDVTASISSDICYGIDFCGGTSWLAFARKGVRRVRSDGTVDRFTASESGLCDDFTYGVVALPDSSALISTASGVSIIDNDARVMNYPSIKSDCIFEMEDGRVLLFGRDGAWRFSPEKQGHQAPGEIRIDHVSAGGRRISGGILAHDENSLSFDASCFNYSESSPLSYFSRMDGLESDWTRFALQDVLQYRNLRPGRYTFRVKACNGDNVQSEDSFSFRIRPAWYASPPAVIAFSVLLAGLLFLVIFFILSRRKLAGALEKKENESREKTRFLIDLSLRMRTPLNLIIGKLERYFRDYGSRSAGSENIEEIYLQSRELRGMISEFVDSRNDAVVEPDVGEKVLQDSRFHNAVIGAVERNLYSPELDIALLCREMNVGKTTLTARLKKTSGMTPRAFIEDIRLKHAAQMLGDGTHRISEIADLLCFCSSKHFCSRFRLKYGCTPSEYRKKTDI